MKRIVFINHLLAHNCILHREGTKHSIFKNNISGKKSTVPRHPELFDDFCKDICKQLGIPKIKK